MSIQRRGFYFSANADKSANDYTIWVTEDAQFGDGPTVRLAARYKNSEPNSFYEMCLDAEDLETFGKMCLDLVARLRGD